MNKTLCRVSCLALCKVALLSSAPVLAQLPDALMLRQIARCGVRYGGAAVLPGAVHEQPCKSPAINELVIKKFADQTYGVNFSYADLSQAWVRNFECASVAIGTPKDAGIVAIPVGDGAAIDQQSQCQIVIKPSGEKTPNRVAYEIEVPARCQAVCSHNEWSTSLTFMSVPEPPFSPSFDCRKAKTAAEKMICIDWELSALDFQAAELWSVRIETDSGASKAAQSKWLESRNTCQFSVQCIREKYQQRVKALCRDLGRKMDSNGFCAGN